VRQLVFVSVALVTLALVPAAGAVGPSLPAVEGGAGIPAATGDVRYVTHLVKSSTRLQERIDGRVARTARAAGAWGVQLATLDGQLTGLSANGRVLVLSDNVRPTGSLRARSRFAVVETRTLEVTATIVLRGDYTVDALSPNGDTLYLIHHVSQADATKYQVQAYDLDANRLLPGVIADKRQEGWTMAGFPVTRATSASGRWVYTLYRQDTNYPFIHALDTLEHRAVCIGLPVDWANGQGWVSNAKLYVGKGKVEVRGVDGKARFVLDTQTNRLVKP
jgi:hypothetical protein